jgi:hypothetical protein
MELIKHWPSRPFGTPKTFLLLSFGLCVFTSGCFGLFDSGVEWRNGPYGLTWIDLPDDVTLSYDQGKGSWGTIVEPRVFAVGSNDHYIVAKQHPRGDKNITNYFIIDIRTDSAPSNHMKALTGPLTEKDFLEKSIELPLPPFSKVLESLK